MTDLSHLESTLVGVAGEYFVAAELSLRGYLASVTLRNSRGIDIIASSADASKLVTQAVANHKLVRQTLSSGRPKPADVFFIYGTIYTCGRAMMRESDLLARITIDPEQCGGRPCIRGMRIRVNDVLELLAAGETPEQILADYSYLQPDDIAASLLYAAHQLDHPILAA